jgi:Tfp pilus assembly protein PilE
MTILEKDQQGFLLIDLVLGYLFSLYLLIFGVLSTVAVSGYTNILLGAQLSP